MHIQLISFSKERSSKYCLGDCPEVVGNQCREGLAFWSALSVQYITGLIFLSFQVDRIIFCTYSQKNWDVYNSLLPRYFPHQLAAVQDTNGKVSYHYRIVSVHH